MKAKFSLLIASAIALVSLASCSQVEPEKSSYCELMSLTVKDSKGITADEDGNLTVFFTSIPETITIEDYDISAKATLSVEKGGVIEVPVVAEGEKPQITLTVTAENGMTKDYTLTVDLFSTPYIAGEWRVEKEQSFFYTAGKPAAQGSVTGVFNFDGYFKDGANLQDATFTLGEATYNEDGTMSGSYSIVFKDPAKPFTFVNEEIGTKYDMNKAFGKILGKGIYTYNTATEEITFAPEGSKDVIKTYSGSLVFEDAPMNYWRDGYWYDDIWWSGEYDYLTLFIEIDRTDLPTAEEAAAAGFSENAQKVLGANVWAFRMSCTHRAAAAE